MIPAGHPAVPFPRGPADLLRLWQEIDQELARRDLVARHRVRVHELVGLIDSAGRRGASPAEIEGLLREFQNEAEGLRGVILARQRSRPWRR